MDSALKFVQHLGRYERLLLAEDLWDEFARDPTAEDRPAVLDELEARAAWRDANPGHDSSLAEVARTLGVRL